MMLVNKTPLRVTLDLLARDWEFLRKLWSIQPRFDKHKQREESIAVVVE
jgi:hypothetical protein